MRELVKKILLTLTLFLVLETVFAQMPSASSGGAEGDFVGILGKVIIFILVIGMGGFAVYLAIKKSKKERGEYSQYSRTNQKAAITTKFEAAKEEKENEEFVVLEETQNKTKSLFFWRKLFLSKRFFFLLTANVLLFILSFIESIIYPKVIFFFPIYPLAIFLFFITCALTATDFLILFVRKGEILAKRQVHNQLSLGDDNPVALYFKNNFGISVRLHVYDELPYQLQKRNLKFNLYLKPHEEGKIDYVISPKKRGVFLFGDINIFVSSPLGLMEKKIKKDAQYSVGVYPSIVQMRKHELNIFSTTATFQGVKQVRRLGSTSEFEQIKNYVQGDDYKHVNWKASSRRNEIMVNQYQDEKAQQVYCIIDKSRSMKMPFDGLTLLDHAINSTLVISNIALRKGDKAGLITFSHKIGNQLKADRRGIHLKAISEILHRQKTEFLDPNYELLYHSVRNTIKGRSLVFLYTNFESLSASKRIIPILRRINSNHLLVVVFFQNSRLSETSAMETGNVDDIYLKTFAQEFVSEKQLIVHELRKLGIQTILSKPEELSINTINKYLELKSRGMI